MTTYKNFNEMKKKGGGFLKSLCECFMRADVYNRRRLTRGFPEVARAYMKKSWSDEGEFEIFSDKEYFCDMCQKRITVWQEIKSGVCDECLRQVDKV